MRKILKIERDSRLYVMYTCRYSCELIDGDNAASVQDGRMHQSTVMIKTTEIRI